MKNQTLVFIVCSPAGRVGKTMTARLLGDYFLLSGRTFAGFDTDAHEPGFAARFAHEVVVSDLNTIQGQMALIDPLLVADGVPKIVDLWHRSLDGFFTLVDHTQFLTEAQRLGITPVLLYLAEGSPRSIETADRLATHYPDLQFVTVLNEGTAPGLESREEFTRYPSARSFKITALDPVLRQTIEEPSFSLSRFMLVPPVNMSIVVRAGLREWLWRIFSQFKSFELRMTLAETEHLG
jgi:hypothetical protein